MNHPLSLLQGRLGVYNKKPYEPMSVEGVEDNSIRLRHQGGHLQQERMILDKKRSLDRAVWNSYQAAEVRFLDDKENRPLRALINPNKLKMDYDDKVISIDYNSGVKIGSVFEWIGTKTYWLVYLQDITELAYFRGDVRKCTYEIQYEDSKGNIQKTYAAIRGPVETRLNTVSMHGLKMDTPNYSLYLLLPKTPENLEKFQRYAKFYLADESGVNKVCWQVEAVDNITSPGIIEIHATENYSNKDEDDIENGIVGGLIEEKQDPNPEEEFIVGETFIKYKKKYSYSASGDGEWKIDSKLPITYTIDENNVITLSWNVSYSGQFDLYYGEHKKTIVVESLF